MRRLLFALLVACGNSADNPDASIAHDSTPIDARPIDAPPVQHQGLITLSESALTGSAPSASVSTSFSDGPPMGAPIATDGPCTTYPTSAHGAYSAGAIAVTGTTTALTLTPNGTPPNVHYTTAPSAPVALFTAGATIHLAAAGATDFVAFAGDVTGPTAIAGFTPPTTVSVSGQTFTWTADASSTIMQIAVYAATAQAASLMLCRVPDNGSFRIPSTSFALLTQNPTTAFIALGRTDEKVVATASGSVTLQAVNAMGSTVTFTP